MRPAHTDTLLDTPFARTLPSAFDFLLYPISFIKRVSWGKPCGIKVTVPALITAQVPR